MSRDATVQAYFDGWNAHDAAAIVGTFAAGGTYEDPTTGGPLSGAAIGENAAKLWAAFPDVSFEIRTHVHDDTGVYAAEWTMRGTNTGSFAGLPPSGRAIEVRGADFIRVGDDGIESVQGYFSPASVPRQIGMQVLVQPTEAGPFTFGNSVRIGGSIQGRPGAFSITSLHPKDAEDVEKVREISRATAAEMVGLDGFMGWVGVTVGDRMLTITAWESPEQSKQVLSLAPHTRGTRGFFGTDYARGGWVSVWTPERFGAAWVRCDGCGSMADAEATDGVCECGAELRSGRTWW